MIPKRLSAKFFSTADQSPNLTAYVPIFQRAIQQQALAGMLIDVADYAHVPQGPGVILIAHEMDYAVDASRGELGIVVTYKHIAETHLTDAVLTLFTHLNALATLLEQEVEVQLPLNRQVVELSFRDRLNFPNQPETLTLVEPALSAVLVTVGGGEVRPVHNDPREPFTVHLALATDLLPIG